MLHLDHTYQKSITQLQAMQKILIFLYQCIFCQNIMTSGGLWNYQRDEVNDDANESNAASNNRISNKKNNK